MSKATIKKARKNRAKIAKTFANLQSHRLHATTVLKDPPECLDRMTVFDVLRRFPHLGRDGAEKVLRNAKVWPLTRFGYLTEEERSKIIANLPPRARR